MAFSFNNVYLRLIAPNTCGLNSGKCEPITCVAPSAGCSNIQVLEALGKATKKELEELRELLATLQKEIEPHIEAADKQPRTPQTWTEESVASN